MTDTASLVTSADPAETDPAALREFLDNAPGMLRTLTESVGLIYTRHEPDESGHCRSCRHPEPCPTRRNLEKIIIPPSPDQSNDP